MRSCVVRYPLLVGLWLSPALALAQAKAGSLPAAPAEKAAKPEKPAKAAEAKSEAKKDEPKKS